MGVLHELLAVEEDAKGRANKIVQEAEKTFRDKQSHFESELIVFKPKTEGAQDKVEKDTAMVTTVRSKLDYVAGTFSKFLDATYQKEHTNTVAKADIVLSDGSELAKDVAATALLNLERELNKLAAVYNCIPTLEPGIKWADAPEVGVDVNKYIQERDRTKKEVDFKTVAPATDKHAAQVVQLNKDVVTGTIETTKYSSKLTPAEKSEILDRLNDLKTAVKKARMRANKVDVKTQKIAKKLFAYINKGEVK